LGPEGMRKVMLENAMRVFQFTPAEPPTAGASA
jgi:hypothetical protein